MCAYVHACVHVCGCVSVHSCMHECMCVHVLRSINLFVQFLIVHCCREPSVWFKWYQQQLSRASSSGGGGQYICVCASIHTHTHTHTHTHLCIYTLARCALYPTADWCSCGVLQIQNDCHRVPRGDSHVVTEQHNGVLTPLP